MRSIMRDETEQVSWIQFGRALSALLSQCFINISVEASYIVNRVVTFRFTFLKVTLDCRLGDRDKS